MTTFIRGGVVVGPVQWQKLKPGEVVQIVSSTCNPDIAFRIVRPPFLGEQRP